MQDWLSESTFIFSYFYICCILASFGILFLSFTCNLLCFPLHSRILVFTCCGLSSCSFVLFSLSSETIFLLQHLCSLPSKEIKHQAVPKDLTSSSKFSGSYLWCFYVLFPFLHSLSWFSCLFFCLFSFSSSFAFLHLTASIDQV